MSFSSGISILAETLKESVDSESAPSQPFGHNLKRLADQQTLACGCFQPFEARPAQRLKG